MFDIFHLISTWILWLHYYHRNTFLYLFYIKLLSFFSIKSKITMILLLSLVVLHRANNSFLLMTSILKAMYRHLHHTYTIDHRGWIETITYCYSLKLTFVLKTFSISLVYVLYMYELKLVSWQNYMQFFLAV